MRLTDSATKRAVVSATCVLLFVIPGESLKAAPRTSARRAKLKTYKTREQTYQRQYSQTLEKLAQAREANRQLREATAIRKMAADAVKTERTIQPLPNSVQPKISRLLPAAERAWRIELRKANLDLANQLFSCAQTAMRGGFGSYAYRLVRDVVRSNPDHPGARRLLGYVRDGGKWVTPFEMKQKRDGKVWDNKFGWLPKADVARYHNGDRFYKRRGSLRGTWIPAAKDVAQHTNFANPWIIRTEHYEVRTNYSLERGVEVARKLEDYYRFFFQTFAGFFNSREQMKQLFAGSTRGSVGSMKPFKVHYYKNKAEYVAKLKSTIPQIARTNGLYLTNTRTAYFFHDPKVDNNRTLYHEATHQVFYESLKKDRTIGQNNHFWIIEGIACYMESFKITNGRITLGDPKYIRFTAAKHRYAVNRYYIPLRKYSSMGMRAFQGQQNLPWSYSQASGLSKFFMEYDGGRYRDALIEHLSQIYRAGGPQFPRVKGLDELTGVAYKQLDRQYGKFIKNLPAK